MLITKSTHQTLTSDLNIIPELPNWALNSFYQLILEVFSWPSYDVLRQERKVLKSLGLGFYENPIVDELEFCESHNVESSNVENILSVNEML